MVITEDITPEELSIYKIVLLSQENFSSIREDEENELLEIQE